ncbi:MAG: hypothetical protein R3208_02395 [Ketobacteraceae bacterium]|nr:hypothetical protein [Ketobacteraceae bacterium]
MAKKTLYVSISGHGYGHIGQMAPILNKLAMDHGRQLEFVIQCQAQERFLSNTFCFDFRHIPGSADVGMVMGNSMDVLPQQSHQAYRELFDHRDRELTLQAREIERHKADLVLSNVSYLTLAAAKRLSLPTIGLCSLNWADIYATYCSNFTGADAVHEQALQCYRSADHFLIPTPGMPMADLPNRRIIGPLSRLSNRYPNFKASLGLSGKQRLVMVSMGGIPHPLASKHWPAIEDVVWLDGSNATQARSDIIPLNRLNVPFVDVLGHCDLVICKPGYGLFAEATCNGIPLLYVKREGWPEQPYLISWLEASNLCDELSRKAFDGGDFQQPVENLLQRARTEKPTPVMPTGVGEACGYILEGLGLVGAGY